MVKFSKIFLLLLVIVFTACGGPEIPESVEIAYNKLPAEIDFNQHVKPILSDKCYTCHGPDKAKIKAGFQLHAPDKAFLELPDSPGKYGIVPKNLNKSEMFHRIISDDEEYIMPSPDSHLTLTDYEKAMLIKWIENGAEYKDHWAFIPPKKVAVPKIENEEHIANAIDNFVLANLEKKGLSPSKTADKELLLRRLSLDLTGLPPTLKELDAFVADTSPKAYEKQVDRLLASPHYGEQMASNWMDLSRFADTHGYSVDRYRDMSPWRDWVIKSYNENMSYTDFITWQLAGDLLENPTQDMILATAFNRNHPQNTEGGIVNEEFLVEYAVDRASTTGQGLMGLTVSCARCHDHKYDPISHKNFYEMTAFFNNINESGQISFNSAMPVPTLLLPTESQKLTKIGLEKLMKGKEKQLSNLETKLKDNEAKDWLSKKSYTKTPMLPKKGLTAYFTLDKKDLKSKIDSKVKGAMKRESGFVKEINLVEGKFGKAMKFNGDTWLDLKKTAVFGRNNPFSISLWANIPNALTDGNIFHKGSGAILYNWRGYHLKIVDNKLELMMAHTAPGNAIIKLSKDNFARDEWIHLAVTYNGSSKADDFKLFVDGKEIEMDTKVDNLYKDILFRNGNEPGLQLGARWRGKGIKDALIDEIKVYNRVLSPIEIMQLSGKNKATSFLSKKPEELSEAEQRNLVNYYIKSISEKASKGRIALEKTRKSYVDSVEKIKEVMVMKENTVPTKTYILDRGVYDAPTDEVFPNTPSAILPMSPDLPKNRLGFAQWLFHKDHPLTARVAVNRYWQHYFGVGLVKTSEDFGNQGEMPSHPKLLDWLSLHFQESGWDIKAMQKLIVMSKTYRQSSMANEMSLKTDKENRLLARGPSKRLSGEMLRDNVLASSGLLNRKIGGQSVKPYQPKGLWSINGYGYTQDKGDKLYRRSLYTIWKRSVPHPTMTTFDAPARDVCTVRRQETNTPLQALVLLNDPIYIETARVLGKNMTTYASVESGISNLFRQLTGRKIKKNELKVLSVLQAEEHKKFKENPLKTKGWINTGEFKIEPTDDVALIAANAVVASTIINADATITKR